MEGIDYTVRRSARARRVRVRVDPYQGVEVVLPHRGHAAAAAEAVRQLEPWIRRRLADAAAIRASVAARGSTVPYLGRPLRLVPEPGRRRVHRRGDDLLVPAGDHRPALERWYRSAARAEMAPRLAAAGAALDVTHTALAIRNQRTRWGSCSSTGAVSLNWRLMLAPEPVLDYVVWHEACHLVHPDHSPRFWALLAYHRPGYAAERAWLQRRGATLVLH